MAFTEAFHFQSTSTSIHTTVRAQPSALLRDRQRRVTALCLSMSPPEILKQLLQSEMDGTRKTNVPILLPCCYDGLTARLVARAGCFEATFMTGFGVSAVAGFPDTQLISYAEMLSACSTVSAALSSAALEKQNMKNPIPCIAVSVWGREMSETQYFLSGFNDSF